MKKFKLHERIYSNIVSGVQSQVISTDNQYNMNDIVSLNADTKSDVSAKITAKVEFDSLEEVFNVIPRNLFGDFSTNEEAVKFYSSIVSGNKYYAYRIKYDTDSYHELMDDQLTALIDMSSISKNNIGHSVCEVLEVRLIDGRDAILKVQFLPSRNSLDEEYKRVKWLRENGVHSPEVYYYNEIDGIKYLLMEKISGLPAFKFKGLGYKLGEELRKIHDLHTKNPEFYNNTTDELLKQVIEKIDAIMPQIIEMYPDATRESVIQFMESNKPENDVLVHGDYSLPNILVDEAGNIGFIDLGDVSISSKYFDFFYLVKSLKRNKKYDELSDFMRGYGIKEFDTTYMKWMEIMDIIIY